MDSSELLKKKCREGWSKKLSTLEGEAKEKYASRIKHELQVIHKLGFDNYFLITADIVEWARSQGIRVGLGRGSAAGSLVSYCLDITRVDPIEHGLYFERFLNENRVSPPDIDLDFQDTRRQEVLDYIIRRYGRENVAMIITYSFSQAKGIVRDLGKVFDIPPNVTDKISKMMWSNDIVEELSKNKDLRKMAEEYPILFEYAKKLQGVIRHTSIHAAGVVISDRPLIDLIPVSTAGDDGEMVVQWDKDDIEEAGFLKMDILGLSALTTIQEVTNVVRVNPAYQGFETFEPDDLPFDDDNIFSLFRKGKTAGIFQFETRGQTATLTQVQPTKFYELADVNALYRPGAKEGIPLYVDGKFGRMEVDYFHPSLKQILEPTYGVITYQEQSIAIVITLAGMTPSEADLLRRGISKGKGIEQYREKFISGCLKNQVDKDLANTMFEILKQGERYAFNKAHSVAYAGIGYQMAYLKVYFPAEFMTAVLNRNIPEEKWIPFEKEFGKDIRIQPWDINSSKVQYNIEGREIRRGFTALKGLGTGAAKHIVDGQPYRSFQDFFSRVKKNIVRANVITSLVEVGSFDSLGEDKEAIQRMLSRGKGVTRVVESTVDLF